MAYVILEKLLKSNQDSIYKLVILASRRALELGAGSERLVSMPPDAKLTSVVLEEIREGKIAYKLKKKQ